MEPNYKDKGPGPTAGALEAPPPLTLSPCTSAQHDSGPLPPASPDRAPGPVNALSPASSSSGSIPELLSRGSTYSPPSTSPPSSVAGGPRDADAKSSALKALAGIGKVVSKSRQIDAEALQAIKAQRARVKAENAGGPGPRHSRNLSTDTESLSSVSDFAGSPLALHGAAAGPFGTAPRPHHRRSISGLPTAATGSPAHMAPRTTPQSYAEILAGMGLADLLALQAAVESEIRSQLTAAGLSIGGGAAAESADAALSAQYTAALLAAQQQQQQAAAAAAAAPALALQQALAGVAAAAAAGGLDSDRRRAGGSLGHSPLCRSPQKQSWPAPPRSAHARSQSIDADVLRSSSPLGSGGSAGSCGALSAAAAAGHSAAVSAGLRPGGMDGMVSLDLAALGHGPLPQGPPTARSLDVGAPAPAPPPGAAAFSSDFTFLSDFPASTGAPTMSLLAPPSPRLASPFTRSAGVVDAAPPAAPADQQQQLPLLFGNMQLGGLENPWR